MLRFQLNQQESDKERKINLPMNLVLFGNIPNYSASYSEDCASKIKVFISLDLAVFDVNVFHLP